MLSSAPPRRDARTLDKNHVQIRDWGNGSNTEASLKPAKYVVERVDCEACGYPRLHSRFVVPALFDISSFPALDEVPDTNCGEEECDAYDVGRNEDVIGMGPPP